MASKQEQVSVSGQGYPTSFQNTVSIRGNVKDGAALGFGSDLQGKRINKTAGMPLLPG